jgi:ATP-dependent DNA ligase
MFAKPKLESVPLAVGLAWRGGNYLYQEKSDGRHEFAQVAGAVLNAERMPSGALVVNDLVSVGGIDVRGENTARRWVEVQALFAGRGALLNTSIRLCRTGQGGEFLEHLLREGGEGVVAKPLDAPFGVGWVKCKRCAAYKCVIAALDHSRGSVELADAATGQPRGKLPLRSRFGEVRTGSVLKVEAFGLTARGMLREARLDRDTETSWLVSY